MSLCCTLGQKVLITEDLEDVEVLEGDSATFKCRISPADYNNVQWFLDKTPLHTNELNEIQSQKGGYHTLTVKKLSMKDSGSISFEAGDKKTSASLVVKGNSPETYSYDLDISYSTVPELCSPCTQCPVLFHLLFTT